MVPAAVTVTLLLPMLGNVHADVGAGAANKEDRAMVTKTSPPMVRKRVGRWSPLDGVMMGVCCAPLLAGRGGNE